jgi:hypothetical protein
VSPLRRPERRFPLRWGRFHRRQGDGRRLPSRGIDCPAARLAVRSLGAMTLGPSGEVCCGIAIPVTGQPAAVAAEHPLSQPDSRPDPPATRTGLGGWKPPVTDDQFTPEPGCLVAELRFRMPTMPRLTGFGAGQRPTSVPSDVAATTNAVRPRSSPTNPSRSWAGRDLWRRSAWKSGARRLEAHIPARAMPATRRGQDLGPRPDHPLSRIRVKVLDSSEKPP